jgi:hypothetical protein
MHSYPLALFHRLTLIALVALGGSSFARAAEEDPSSAETLPAVPATNVAAPSEQAPASAPAPSSANLPTGLIERLPSTAYPEPVTRGIYGGSLWSTFHGLQWPYYPRTGIGISGYGWLDTGYERINRGDPAQPTVKELLQQGRILLRVTPTYSSGTWFVQAQAEFLANKDQSRPQTEQANVDDVWIRTGQWQRWDVTVGRFEAFEVYHLGMGLDINTEERVGAVDASAQPPDFYGATFLFGRPKGLGDVALHLYPARFLRFELLGQVGNEGVNTIGGRPAIVFDFGWLKLKAAGEYSRATARNVGDKTENRNSGYAGTAQFVFDPFVEFGINAGSAVADVFDNIGTNDTAKSYDKLSLGGFLNARLVIPDLILGLGANRVRLTDTHLDATTNELGHFNNFQSFVALQYLIAKQLFIKVVGAYATADFNPSFTNGVTPHSNTMYSGRVRLTFLF